MNVATNKLSSVAQKGKIKQILRHDRCNRLYSPLSVAEDVDIHFAHVAEALKASHFAVIVLLHQRVEHMVVLGSLKRGIK